MIDGLVLGPAADEAIEVAGLELVGVGGQRSQVGHAVAAGAGAEHVVEGERGQHGEPSGTAAPDCEPPAVHIAPVGQEAGHRHAVVHVEHPPVAAQTVPVGASVAGGAPVVDIGHGEPPAGPVGDAELQLRAHTAGRAAVDEDDQRRPLPLWHGVVRVGGRVDEGVCVLVSGGREAERLGDRQQGRIEAEVTGRSQDLGAGGRHRHDLGLGGPRGGDHHHAISPCGHRPDRGGIEVHLVEGAIGPQHGEVVHTTLPASEPHVVAHEGVPGEPEHPLGRGDLELAERQPDEVFIVEAVQVPPAVPVRDHVQHPVGPPLGLEERLPRRRHAALGGDRTVTKVGDPQSAVVPRQVRMVPLDPRQAAAVGRDPGRRHEVGPRHEHLDPLRAVERNGDDLVGGLAVQVVVLAYAHVPAAVRRGAPVGEAEAPGSRRLRRQGQWGTVRTLEPEPLVVEIAVDEAAVERPPGATAVLVDQGPNVGIRSDDVDAVAHDHDPPALVGSGFGPPDAVAFDDDLAQPGSTSHQGLGSDR